MQLLPSSHGPVKNAWVQPSLGSQASVVQALLSSQLTAVPGKQLPPWQASLLVQALASLHALVFGAYWQPF